MTYRKAMAALALALLVSGCAQAKEEERTFKVPDSLCGTPVPAELLSPVLPTGGETITEEKKIGNGYFSCTVSVDGTGVLHVSWSWWGGGTSTTKVTSSQRGVRLDEHVSKDGTYTFADKGGASRVTCPDPRAPGRKGDTQLFAQIFLLAGGRPDEATMEGLIQVYAKGLSASSGCMQK